MAQGNILVVDDDESVRLLLMEYLRERACLHVDGARDGVEALHQIAIKPYTVVVLDVMMPYMSGIDFLTSLDALLSDPSVKSLDDPPALRARGDAQAARHRRAGESGGRAGVSVTRRPSPRRSHG
jgi:CheY-like chemotaxis protein